MTAQQLKNSILQMAVQGKLVSQDPNDEPASILLERIRAEKEQMIKEGKIKKEKNPSIIFHGDDNLPYEKVGDSEPVCIADELPFDIPDSWVWARFGEIVLNFDNQRKPVAKDKRTTTHGYYDYYGATGAIDKVDNYIFEGEYLMIGEDGGNFFTERDNSFIADGKFWANNHVHVVCPVVINIWFLKFFLDSCNLPAMGLINGIAVPKLNQEHLNSIIVPIPPIQEQEAIVEKVKIFLPLLNYYDVAEKQLSSLEERFPNQLKKSILQQAVQGKLVPQDPADEPASVLLERIRAEKEQMIKDGKIKRDKHESVIYRRDDSYFEKVDGIERCIDDEIPFEIPENWEWARLRSVAIINPRNNIVDDCDAAFMPMTLLMDGYRNAFSYETKKWHEIKSGFTHFSEGDIVIAKITPCFQNRKSAIVSELPNGIGAGTTELHVVRNINNTLDSEYLLWLFKTSYFIDNGVKAFTGTAGQQRVGKEYMANFLVPVPPRNEQHRIVKTITALLSIIENSGVY